MKRRLGWLKADGAVNGLHGLQGQGLSKGFTSYNHCTWLNFQVASLAEMT